MQPINKLKPGFLTKCLSNLKDTDPPIFCKICGSIKKEFISPMHANPKLIVLDCACEQEYKMHKEEYELYRQCRIKSGNNALKYGEIIDGYVAPKTDEEIEIFKYGICVRDNLREIEIKLSR